LTLLKQTAEYSDIVDPPEVKPINLAENQKGMFLSIDRRVNRA